MGLKNMKIFIGGENNPRSKRVRLNQKKSHSKLKMSQAVMRYIDIEPFYPSSKKFLNGAFTIHISIELKNIKYIKN